MKIKRESRKTERSPEEIAKIRGERERYQRDKPTPEQLLAEGGHEDFVPLGQYLELHAFSSWMKQQRAEHQMTLAKMSELTGIDQAALSRLENGQNTNPTIDTLYRVASALGKMIYCSFGDVGSQPESPTEARTGKAAHASA